MHLWPSMKIRDSFKTGYLTKLEWNINRMKSEKNSQNDQNLLEAERDDDGQNGGSTSKSQDLSLFCRELLMLLSCCYCCFCCGACVDEQEN